MSETTPPAEPRTGIAGVRYVDTPSAGADFPEAVRRALGRIEQYVNSARSLEEVLDCLWETTEALLPRDRIAFSFLEQDGQRVVARACRAAYGEIRLGEGYAAGLAGSTLKPLLDSSTTRIIPDLSAYLEKKPDSHSTRLLVDEGVRASITLPLGVQDRSVGFFFVSSRSPDVYTEEHGRILHAVRMRISQSVEKAWLLHRLQQTNRNYIEMLGFVSHEMKSPLAALVATGEIYTGGYAGEIDPTAEKTIRKMLRLAGYLRDMVGNYLDLAKLEGGELRFDPEPDVDLTALIARAVELVEENARERGSSIRVETPERPVVLEQADPSLLSIVLVNLIDNAVKYGYDAIEVRVTLSLEGDEAVLVVRNPGVGFTEKQAAKLFRRFSRLKQKGTEDRRGTGLGLYLTWWALQQHEGTITPRSEPGEWAEFTVRIPGARSG